MKTISLTQGKFAIADDEDFECINQWKWKFSHGYACRTTSVIINGKKVHKVFYMHRLIMNTPKGMETDHIDTNKLHNCRDNLRIVTRKQNKQNVNKRKGANSKYKGVSWDKSKQKWRSYITLNKQITLGRFSSEVKAAEVYNEFAKKYFGEFARLNIV